MLSFDELLDPQVPLIHQVTPEVRRNRTLLSLDEMTVRHIRQALEMAGGKINGPGGAAQILGLHPNTLRTRMSKLGIPYGRKSWQPHSIEQIKNISSYAATMD